VIPPAWKSVRISPAASSNLQALGIDTTGRIQISLPSEIFRKTAA
jgi:DNA topoisomerase IB